MTDANKTVFISYRRDVSSFVARAVFMDLRAHGYDAFMDIENIDSGAFDTVILNQIKARAHFVLILTPGSLERCLEPGDWLRQEIETAMDFERNIVPLMVSGFSFTGVEPYLTGKLSKLACYNALNVPHDYFEAAMERLRSRFLKQPVAGVIVPTPFDERQDVEQKVEKVASQFAPTEKELTAEECLKQGNVYLYKGEYAEAKERYQEAIHLNPHYATPHFNLGMIHHDEGDFAAAIADFDKAIALDLPDMIRAYYRRGLANHALRQFDSAIDDLTEAIQLNTRYAKAYFERGNIYNNLQNWAEAIRDFSDYINLEASDCIGYNNRAIAHRNQGDMIGALADYDRAIELNPDYTYAYNNRGEWHYITGDFKAAVEDFEKAHELDAYEPIVLGGLAVTHHALGNYELAEDLWKSLLKRDEKYQDVDWVKNKFNWHEALAEEARKLIARLD